MEMIEIGDLLEQNDVLDSIGMKRTEYNTVSVANDYA